jgi:hypothetical protein
MELNMDVLIDKYIQLRDKKAQIKAEYEANAKKIDLALDKVENVILAKLNEAGADSIGTEAGIAFKQTTTSATVADRDAFRAFIEENDAWHLADIRAAKTAVAEYRAANDDLPPGINWREETVVRVRRA